MDSLKTQLEAIGYITYNIGEELAVGFKVTQGHNAGSIILPLGVKKLSVNFVVRFVMEHGRDGEQFSSESQLITFIKNELPL